MPIAASALMTIRALTTVPLAMIVFGGRRRPA
jgi:hypothetical protein